MTKNTFRLAGGAIALLSLVATTFADLKVNDNISVNGYVVGSYTYTDYDNGKSINTYFGDSKRAPMANADAVKLGVLATSGQFSGYGSILYLPGAANEAGLLDAYATYDTGAGVKITGGKFLSYLGYEAFDPINMAQLTYGSTISAVPAYHTGGKIDYSTKTFSAGLAVVDSIFSGKNGFFEGDREYDNDIGFEAMVSYTGIEKLTVFAGLATENTYKAKKDLFIFNLWASYALSDTVTVAAEVITQDDLMDGWLAFVSYKSSDKISTAFRVSGASWDKGGNDTKYTVAPTYTVNKNVSFRGEVSLAEGKSGDYMFYGVQAILKF